MSVRQCTWEQKSKNKMERGSGGGRSLLEEQQEVSVGHLKKNSLHIFCFSLFLQERDKMCSSQEKHSIYIPVGR